MQDTHQLGCRQRSFSNEAAGNKQSEQTYHRYATKACPTLMCMWKQKQWIPAKLLLTSRSECEKNRKKRKEDPVAVYGDMAFCPGRHNPINRNNHQKGGSLLLVVLSCAAHGLNLMVIFRRFVHMERTAPGYTTKIHMVTEGTKICHQS